MNTEFSNIRLMCGGTQIAVFGRLTCCTCKKSYDDHGIPSPRYCKRKDRCKPCLTSKKLHRFCNFHIKKQKDRENVHKISVAKNIPEELERGILEFLT